LSLCKTAYAKKKKLLFIIHKLVKVVYEQSTYEDTIFVSENL